MLSSNISLFSLINFLCICFYVGSSHANKCAETDRLALLQLKDGFVDKRKTLNSWKGEDCCKWKGISCDNLTAHVTNLNLSDSRLEGKMDSSICELKYLTFFDLTFNQLEGVIPKCIGSLAQLIELKLGDNHLIGDIPPTLGNLSNLQTLDFGGNYFLAGNDLEWVSHLSALKYLRLSHVNLSQSADWLSSISKIPSLSELRLDGCGIDQSFPEFIPHFNSSSSLKTLSLSSNQLNSSTLSLLLNVSKVLTYLDLSSNSLQHNISDGFVNMDSLSHLRYLYLSDNKLEGNTLKYIPSLFQLKELKLDQNKLPGNPVDYIRQLCYAQNSLEVLYLGNNPFRSAPLPDFSCLSSLKTLSLRNVNIIGSLPQSFGHLPHLSTLDLSGNQLSGLLPLFEISKLASLETLDLSNNQLNGTLPSTIWQLSSLQTLVLSSNKLNGVDVIRELHASNLSFLDLMDNQLSGSQPLLEISKLTSLEEMYLSNNQLNGTLPSTIGQLSSLRRLYLNSNKLSGVVKESHLSNLSQLEYLNVGQNALAFNFNSNWVPPFQLYEFAASSCILGPKFPTWLKQQRELGYLQISNSGISDSFPNWFWNLPSSWSYLNVSHNKISGALPLSLPSTKRSYYNVWDFSFNNLSGPLPPFPELDVLILSNNIISGSITSFCATSPMRLNILDLSSNLLSGTLSDCDRKFQRLYVLNLAKNNLSGRIPKSFGTLQQIVSINLNSNNFSGEIPSLTFCSGLRFIDLGKNNLQGTLPPWVGHNLSQLTVLRLEANKFHGSIPTNLCNLLFLQVLDLSENNITGMIPQCFSRIIALSNMTFSRQTISFAEYATSVYDQEFYSFIDKAMLEWKGEKREYEKNLGLMTIIDLSCNQLTGEIPKSITTLAALTGLNLSRNNLTGFIPDNIGHMKMLESLDLSRNHLCGRMPASFSNLTFLSYMDLSFNNLSGKIPHSTQLQTFDASAYTGNSGLCGPPLPNHCSRDVVSPNGSINKNSTEEDGDEDELITIGFYIALGFGFCFGFWGVCGTLVIKSSWRHGYFQFLNNLNDWICARLIVFMARMKRRFQVQE